MAQKDTFPEIQGKPDEQNLSNALEKVTNWHQLGIILGIPSHKLSKIEEDYQQNDRRMSETLVTWLQQTPSASWNDVVSALQQMGEKAVAESVRQKYIGGVPSHPVSPALTVTVSQFESMPKSSMFVHENLKAISSKFGDLRRKVCDRLKNGVDIENFCLFAKDEFRPGDFIPSLPTTLTEIFEAITQNGLWDYFHYSPLLKIVKRYGAGDTEMSDWIQNYRKDFRSYLLLAEVKDFFEAELDDYMEPSPAKKAKHDPRYCCPMEWKVDLVEHCRLHYLADVWEAFSSHYLMPDSPPTALLDRISKGCVSITWLVPSSLIPQLKKRVKVDTDFFQKHRIRKVTVGGQCIYEEEPFKDGTSDEPSDSEGEGGADRFSQTLDSAQQSEDFPPKVLPDENGYECEIVESPPWAAHLPTNCPICLHVLRNPQQTICGHTFCKMCIKQAQASKTKMCPTCKRTKVTTFPHESLRRLLNDLQVRCTFQNEERTCDWTGKLREFEQHLNLIPKCEDELLTGCELVAIHCKFSYAGCKAQMPRKDMANHMKEQSYHIELLAERVKKQKGELQRLTIKLRNKDEETARIIHQIQEESTLKLQSKDDEIENITRKMKEVEAKLQIRDEELAQIMIEKRPLVQPIPVLYHFKMDKFKSRKRRNAEWYSKPFYTHQQGYKMCVRIDANGYRGSRGTHVSLFTCIMKGEYDDKLPWPFHGKITVELLNQNAEHDHYKYTITYGESVGADYAGRVRTGDRNQGWGNSEFFPHLDLKHHKSSPTIQYLKDDCLEIRVREVLLYNIEAPLPICS